MIHFNNNENLVTDKKHPDYDTFFKVRPLIAHLAEKFQEIPKSQRLCVSEQIIPFKGVSSLKQYLPLKPSKWGYKVYFLCGADGVMYEFFIHNGKIEHLPHKPDLKASSNAVVNLTQTIPSNLNHLLYFDRWFTSIALQT